MSDETVQQLKEAEAVVAERRKDAENRKRECLKVLADRIPAEVEKIAKRTAQSQPEVTKALGSAGIRELRRQLAERASELAAEIESAVDQIQWPSSESEWSPVLPRHVHSALFKFMYGQRVDSLAAIFKRHGYSIHDDNARRSQSLVMPQSLYREDDFSAVAEALTSLAKAERDCAKAKAADDEVIVDAIWDDA